MKAAALLLLSALVGSAFAATGIDVSQLFSTSDWSCVSSYGYTFAIIRCYCSTGHTDSNCAQSIRNAKAAGIQYVDVYIFPCPTCGSSGASQVQATVDYVANNGVASSVGQYWLGT
eukprot:TRINITY_DN3593_c0_g1_i3.p1 TRINITY_DN3593_c0_g1~~TRINITY_DN3593_c0_g1_i3.p1  ORF type:complete len:125 (-),score=30.43 TRINITY_DN3593_c0_g1_i3:74-421(-)